MMAGTFLCIPSLYHFSACFEQQPFLFMKKPLTDKGFRAILKAKTEHLGGVRYERNYCPLTERE